MRGKIIRGIGGFYYVYAQDDVIYECRAKGIFRKDKKKPLVGDDVEISIISREEKTGNVDILLPRSNALIRPAVANVDQAAVLFAAAAPRPNLNLLDRFLINMAQQDIPVIICFNKTDLISEEEAMQLSHIYEKSGHPILLLCVEQGKGLEKVRELFHGKTTVLAGPSGVGKSSLTNALQSGIHMEVGSISEKIDRGKHTTRHTELMVLEKDSYLLDTPGFSSLYVQGIEPENLRDYYPEFTPYGPRCRFLNCLHLSEPDCAVKQALEAGEISTERYENYGLLIEELKNSKRRF